MFLWMPRQSKMPDLRSLGFTNHKGFWAHPFFHTGATHRTQILLLNKVWSRTQSLHSKLATWSSSPRLPELLVGTRNMVRRKTLTLKSTNRLALPKCFVRSTRQNLQMLKRTTTLESQWFVILWFPFVISMSSLLLPNGRHENTSDFCAAPFAAYLQSFMGPNSWRTWLLETETARSHMTLMHSYSIT